jgi:hypothetical protein
MNGRSEGDSMQVELSDDEVELLREVLDTTVADLSPEIADTDNPFYRRGLVGRRDHIRAILDKLGGPVPRI